MYHIPSCHGTLIPVVSSAEILYSQLPTSLANLFPIHMDIYLSREDLSELPKLLLKNTLSQPQVSFFHSTDIICYLFVYFIDQHWFCPPDCMHREDEGHLLLFVCFPHHFISRAYCNTWYLTGVFEYIIICCDMKWEVCMKHSVAFQSTMAVLRKSTVILWVVNLTFFHGTWFLLERMNDRQIMVI